MDPKTRVAVVGATGVVGRELLGLLQGDGVAPENVTLLGTDRSDGVEIDYGDDSLAVERLEPGSFRNKQIVFLATPDEASKTLAVQAQEAGAWVVDLSRAFAAGPAPVILPGFNDGRLRQPFLGRIVRVPSPLATAAVLVLEPLRAAFGLQSVNVTAMMGASQAGSRGVDELEKQTAHLLSGKELEATLFPHRLAFNMIPQVGPFSGAWTTAEEALQYDAEQLWAGAEARVHISATALQVPTFFGHMLSIVLDTQKAASFETLLKAFAGSNTVKVVDSTEEGVYPMPMLITADAAIHVGRMRVDPKNPQRVLLVAAIDNAVRGGALSAFELGDLLMRQAH